MKNPILAPELREFIADSREDELRSFCESSHPVVVAELLSTLTPGEAWAALRLAAPPFRAEIFSHLEDDIQVELATTLRREEVARLLADMPPDDRVDLLKRVPEDKLEAILPGLAQAEREDIRRLSAYRDGTAGSVMTSDYATLSPDLTAVQAIARLRREAPNKETIYYAYVVDGSRKLIGFVSLKDLILARSEDRVEDLMHREVIFTGVDDDQEDAARKIQKFDLIALPVTDGGRTLVGIITHDDAIDIITQEQTEDMEKFMAITGEHQAWAYVRSSPWDQFQKRAGWVLILGALGFVSGLIVQNFEGLILQFAILATFMPMLADTGGNTGSQAATLVVRALALKEITSRDFLRVLAKEFQVSLLLGLTLAGLAFARVIVFPADPLTGSGHSLTVVGLAVAVAIGLQVVTATLIGAMLPLFAARLKLDPALVASPALTTIVDITGLLIYFLTVKAVVGL